MSSEHTRTTFISRDRSGTAFIRGLNTMGKKNKKKSTENKSDAKDSKDKESSSKDDRVMKFAPKDVGSKTKYHTFATVRDHIALKIQKDYEEGVDLANAIKSGVPFDPSSQEPVEKVSTLKDPVAQAAEQRRFGRQYDVKYEQWEKSKKRFKINSDNACALIFDDYCTKEMKDRLLETTDWDTVTSRDPLLILETIKNNAHSPVRSQYRAVLLVDSILNWFGIKQSNDEDLIDYFKRGKQLEEVWRTQMGRKCLEFFVSHDPEYLKAVAENDTDAKNKIVNDVYDEVAAYVMIRGADKNKYESFKTFLGQQYSLGIDQYPKTTKLVQNSLRQRKFDQKYYDLQKQKNEKAKKKADSKKTDGGGGTAKSESSGASFKQGKAKDLFCYCCGQDGHSSNKCPNKSKIAPNDWVIRKAAKAHMQKSSEEKESTADKATEKKDGGKKGWSWFQYPVDGGVPGQREFSGQQGKFDFLGNTIILDTGSTINATIMNPKFVHNVRESDSPILMSTNAGTKRLNMDADMEGIGTVKYDPEQKANIFGFSHLSDKYRITCDTEKDDAFYVHTENGIRRFGRKDRLYCYTPSDEYLEDVAGSKGSEATPSDSESDADESISENVISSFGIDIDENVNVQECHVIESVKENLAGFTDREISQARRARALYYMAGAPTIENFKHLLWANMIQDCPVTVKDVDLAEKIFGPDIGALKGRTVRKKPRVVRQDNIEVPDEIARTGDPLVLAMDPMFVNGMPFLAAIDDRIKFRSTVRLEDKKKEQLYSALDKILRAYNGAGYEFSEIHCDNEFKPIMDAVKDDMGVSMEYPPAKDHVPAAERNNRVIGERVRATYHRLPYKNMPRIMWEYLVFVSTAQLNWFPVKGGVSKYYSPHHLLKKRQLNYKRHFVVPFGSYVQANEENNPTNDNRPRSLDAIYLRPSSDRQGGHDLMHLATGELITRQRVWKLPITDRVISAVHALARRQGMKSLKIKDKHGVSLLPADWVAGVDYGVDKDVDEARDADYDPDSDDGSEGGGSAGSDSDSDDDDDSDGSDLEMDPITEDEINDLHRDADNDDEDDDPTQRDTPQRRGDENNDNQENAQDAEQDRDDVSHGNDDDAGIEGMPGEVTPERPGQQDEKSEADSGSISSSSSIDGIFREIRDNIGEAADQFRPVRSRLPPERLTYDHHQRELSEQEWKELEASHNISTVDLENVECQEYGPEQAVLAARIMTGINNYIMREGAPEDEKAYGQQYVIQKGIKMYGEDAINAAMKELDQLHKRQCFTPVSIKDMTPEELERAQNGIMLINEKRSGEFKGRYVFNGKNTREWIPKEDTASPTVAMESISQTAVIEAKEERDVATGDVPNAFIQALLDKWKKENQQYKPVQPDRVFMKITGILVTLLLRLAPEVYGPFVVYENGRRVLYVHVLRALYGMLVAALRWYETFTEDLLSIGFEINPYDPCVANRIIRNKQQTVCFHVDDIKSSHVDPEVNTMFLEWLNEKYGEFGKVKATRGKVHDYLGMTLDYSKRGTVKIDMTQYTTKMLTEFRQHFKLDGTAETPAAPDLFGRKGEEILDNDMKEIFHTFVAKCLFLCKRARPDIQMATTVLATRVQEPNRDDWKKLIRVLKFLNGTINDSLTLRADNLHSIKWYVDASFAVHPDFKSHSGAVMTMGQGAIQSGSSKQKLVTRSSCEAELVGADDMATKILWTKLFMEAQGYKIKRNVLYQDNKSTILLLKNGKRSSGKRTRALNIRYFFLHDQQEKGNLAVEYCPTGDMIGDYMTKPKQGKDFRRFRKAIMGIG